MHADLQIYGRFPNFQSRISPSRRRTSESELHIYLSIIEILYSTVHFVLSYFVLSYFGSSVRQYLAHPAMPCHVMPCYLCMPRATPAEKPPSQRGLWLHATLLYLYLYLYLYSTYCIRLLSTLHSQSQSTHPKNSNTDRDRKYHQSRLPLPSYQQQQQQQSKQNEKKKGQISPQVTQQLTPKKPSHTRFFNLPSMPAWNGMTSGQPPAQKGV